MRKTLILGQSLLILLLLPSLAAAQSNEKKAISRFLKGIRPAAHANIEELKGADLVNVMNQQASSISKRNDALDHLQDLDSKPVAEAVVKASLGLTREVETLEAERMVRRNERSKLDKLRTYNPQTKRSTMPKGAMDRWNALGQEIGAMRGPIDGARSLMVAVNDRLLELKDLDALRWLVKSVVGNKKYSIHLKLIAAQAAGGAGKAMLIDLVAALKKAKKPPEMLALIDGLALMGEDAKPASQVLIQLMQHKEEPVRERAALALSKVAVPNAIEPMINLLAISEGQVKKRVAASLEVLTGQEHGTNPSTWKRWFAAEGADYLAGKHELGGGSPSAKKEFDRKNYYFGIPQDGKSIVYIIDASGSMKAPVKVDLIRKPGGGDKGGGGGTASPERKKPGGEGDGKAKKTTRLEACKKELIRALGRLAPDVRFNVLWFSSEPHMHLPKMTKASSGAIKKAQDWVRKLQPNGSTNIHDTLQSSFTLTGRGAKDKHYDIDFDTIFMLTDGSPTLPPGNKPDSTEKILKAVRLWNPLKRVTVHCIGIGNGVNRVFMEQLASENGGEFKHILD